MMKQRSNGNASSCDHPEQRVRCAVLKADYSEEGHPEHLRTSCSEVRAEQEIKGPPHILLPIWVGVIAVCLLFLVFIATLLLEF